MTDLAAKILARWPNDLYAHIPLDPNFGRLPGPDAVIVGDVRQLAREHAALLAWARQAYWALQQVDTYLTFAALLAAAPACVIPAKEPS